MLFSLENKANGSKTHCGVLEFIAEEGMIYMPYWVSAGKALVAAHSEQSLAPDSSHLLQSRCH